MYWRRGRKGKQFESVLEEREERKECTGGEGGKENSLRVCWRRGRKGKSVLEEREERN